MKYMTSIDIDLPRERVVALFDDPANLKRWQPDLRSVEHVAGLPGEVGAVSRLTYRNGRRERVVTETVALRQLPDRFTVSYGMAGASVEVDHRFQAVAPERTRWLCDVGFRFDNPFMKLLGLFPGMFRQRTERRMQQFKEFAESQTDEGLERTQFEPQS